MRLTVVSNQDFTAEYIQILSEVFRLHGWTDEDELYLITDPSHAERIPVTVDDGLFEVQTGVINRVDFMVGNCPDYEARVETVSVAETLGTAGGKTKLSWAVRQLLDPYQGPEFNFQWVRAHHSTPNIPPGLVAFDIEVSGDIRVDEPLDTELLSVALAWDEPTGVQGVVLGIDALASSKWLDWLKHVLTSYPLVTHNGKFDLRWTNDLLDLDVTPTHDTQLMHHAMFPGAGEHGLKPLAQRILGAEDWETGAKQFLKGSKAHYERIPQEHLTTYNAWDVYWTLCLFHELNSLIDEDARKAYKHALKASHMIQAIEAYGMGVDFDYAAKLDDFYAKMRQDALAGVENYVANPNSVPQVKHAVKEHFGVELSDTESKTLRTTVLENPQNTALKDFVDNLLQVRTATKFRSTNVTSILEKARNGRVHPNFLVHGTVTGRLSSHRPNFQNLPTGDEMPIRKMYRARRGYVIARADYSQAELRTVAELSDDEKMIADLQPESPDFFNSLTPSIFPDVDFTLLDKAELEGYRSKVKETVYGCVPYYTTMGGWTFGEENMPTHSGQNRVLDARAYGMQDTVLLKHSYSSWQFVVTWGHRWLVRRGLGELVLVETQNLSMSDHIVVDQADTFKTIPVSELEVIDQGVQPVWCPTTDTGLWVMEQPFSSIKTLTGNSNYGLTAKSIAEKLTLDGHPTTYEEALSIQSNYLDHYPGLQEWRASTLPDVIKGDQFVTPFGRRFHQDVVINDFRSLNRTQNQAWAFRPQSIASDICTRAAITLWDIFQSDRRYKDCHIVAIVHDEIFTEVPEELGQEVLKIMVSVMEETGATVFHRVPFLADGSIGPTFVEEK